MIFAGLPPRFGSIRVHQAVQEPAASPTHDDQLRELVAKAEEWHSAIQSLYIRYKSTYREFHVGGETHSSLPRPARRSFDEWAQTRDGQVAQRSTVFQDNVVKAQYWEVWDGKRGLRATYDKESLSEIVELDSFLSFSVKCEILHFAQFVERPIHWYFKEGLVLHRGLVHENARQLLRFEIERFPQAPFPMRYAFVLDPNHDFLPVNQERFIPTDQATGNPTADLSWYRSSVLTVGTFISRDDGFSSPGKAESSIYNSRGDKVSSKEYEIEKFDVVTPPPEDIFLIEESAPMGTPVIESGRIIRFVGGDEGKRLFLEKYPERAHLILAELSPLVQQTNEPRSVSTTLILTFIALAVLCCAASVWLRKRAQTLPSNS